MPQVRSPCRLHAMEVTGALFPLLGSSMISMMSSAKEKEPPADNEMHLDAGQSGSAKKVNALLGSCSVLTDLCS